MKKRKIIKRHLSTLRDRLLKIKRDVDREPSNYIWRNLPQLLIGNHVKYMIGIVEESIK